MFRFPSSAAASRAALLVCALVTSGAVGAQAFDPDTFDFGDVPVGVASPPQVFTFTNTSNAPLQVQGLSFATPNIVDFALVGTDCFGVIAALASCDATMTFTPVQVGPRIDLLLLEVIDGGGNGARYGVELHGNGVEPPADAADVALTLEIDDATATPGQPLLLTAQIQNLGPDAAADVTVAIELPAGSADSASANGAGWVCALIAPVLNCTRPALAALAQAPLTVAFDAPQVVGGQVIAGEVASATADPALANNDDSVAFDVANPPPPPPPAQAKPNQIPATGSLAALLLICGALVVAWRTRQA